MNLIVKTYRKLYRIAVRRLKELRGNYPDGELSRRLRAVERMKHHLDEARKERRTNKHK